VTLLLCGLNVAWLWLAAAVRPDWGAVAINSLMSSMPRGGLPDGLVFFVVAIVGTTISVPVPQLLSRDPTLLDARFINRRWNDIVNWIVISMLFGLSLVLAARALVATWPPLLF
jgi:hypothetical protein